MTPNIKAIILAIPIFIGIILLVFMKVIIGPIENQIIFAVGTFLEGILGITGLVHFLHSLSNLTDAAIPLIIVGAIYWLITVILKNIC